MRPWRKRKRDIRHAARRLQAAEAKVLDLAIRRARLEAEAELYALQPEERRDDG